MTSSWGCYWDDKREPRYHMPLDVQEVGSLHQEMLCHDGRVGGVLGLFRIPSPPPAETHASYGTMVVGLSWLGIALARLKDALPPRGGPWLVTRLLIGFLTLSLLQNTQRGTTLKKE